MRLVKAVLDRLLALLGLVLLSPVFAGLAIWIVCESGRPVIFRQRRAGRNAKRFTMLKFRTMVDGAEALLPTISARSITNGPIFKDPGDFRVTPIGPTQISEFLQGNQHFYRVRVGPLRSVADADAALGRVVGQGQSDARVVVD